MKDDRVENTCSQIGSLLSGMTAVCLPELQFGMLFHSREPGGSHRCDWYIQFLCDSHIPSVDLNLHALKIIHAVLWHSIPVRPGNKEDGCCTDCLDFVNQLTRRRIHLLVSYLLNRGNLALLLQHHKIPFCRIQ